MSHWNEIENEAEVLEEYLYGQPAEDEEYWLGEQLLDEVIQ